jgi:hypothetical protein
MAIVMLACGPRPSVDAYIDCYKQRMTFVKSMKPTDARLAALRGELNITRETFVSHKKFIEPEVAKGVFVDWFNHGILDLKTGRIAQDKNFAHMPTFEQAYQARWKQAPRGEFYDAYVLVKSYRDVLQKSLWVGKNNPNTVRLQTAVRTMLADPEALSAIVKDGGDYEWFVGQDMTRAYQTISNRVTEPALKNLYKFTVDGMGLEAEYKPELIGKR